jgi:hypothetical protein
LRSRFALVAKHTRWMRFEVPLFVRVEVDDEYEDDRVTQVVLAVLDGPSYEGVELARDWTGHYLVYDGGPDAERARACSDDALGRAAVLGCREGCCHQPQTRTFPLVDGCAAEGFLVIRGTG